jgi:pyruvate,water dikinase
MRATFWLTQRVFEEEKSQQKQSGTRLTGVAASAGEVSGVARIVLGEDDFDKIEPGDVLVCPITSPVWSVLFPSISALVSDSGGVLSHPAIIAREYGIPAVVGTGNATEVLKDGQAVKVDGTAGTVTAI